MDKGDNNRPTTQHNRGVRKIALLFIFIILLIIAGYLIYNWQHNQVTDLNRQVGTLQTQLDKAKKAQNQPITNPLPQPTSTYTYYSSKSVKINVYAPQKGATVSSLLAVIGEVPGSWSFEASFPVKLLDSKGNTIAQTSAHVLGDWMTDIPVPFSAQLTWSPARSGTGTLVLEKDNPSGLASNDDSVSIPVKF